MDANQFIDEMIDTIDKRGWCQGEIEAYDGSMCILGAYHQVFGSHYSSLLDNGITLRDVSRMAKRRILDQIKSHLGYEASIAEYNDHVAETAEEVILLLQRSKVAE